MDEECFFRCRVSMNFDGGSGSIYRKNSCRLIRENPDKSGKTGRNSPEMEKWKQKNLPMTGSKKRKAKLSVSIEQADLFEEMLQIEGVKGFILTANAFWIFGCVNRFRRWHRDARGRKGSSGTFFRLCSGQRSGTVGSADEAVYDLF